MQFCGKKRYPVKEAKVFGGPFVSCAGGKGDGGRGALREEVKRREEKVAALVKKDRMLREVEPNVVGVVPGHGVQMRYGKKRSPSVDTNDSRNPLMSVGLLAAQEAVKREGYTSTARTRSDSKPPLPSALTKKPTEHRQQPPKREEKILHFKTPPPPSPARVRSSSTQPVQRDHFGVNTVPCYAAFDPSKETRRWPATTYRKDMEGSGVQDVMNRRPATTRSNSAVPLGRRPQQRVDQAAAGGSHGGSGSKRVFSNQRENPFAPLHIPPPPPLTTSGCIIDIGFNDPQTVRNKQRTHTPKDHNPIAHTALHGTGKRLDIRARASHFNPILGL